MTERSIRQTRYRMTARDHRILPQANPDFKGGRRKHVDARTAELNREYQEDAEELAKAFDNLPLAAEHAGAYIAETGISIQEYIKLFNANVQKILATDIDGRYP